MSAYVFGGGGIRKDSFQIPSSISDANSQNAVASVDVLQYCLVCHGYFPVTEKLSCQVLKTALHVWCIYGSSLR